MTESEPTKEDSEASASERVKTEELRLEVERLNVLAKGFAIGSGNKVVDSQAKQASTAGGIQGNNGGVSREKNRERTSDSSFQPRNIPYQSGCVHKRFKILGREYQIKRWIFLQECRSCGRARYAYFTKAYTDQRVKTSVIYQWADTLE